jgi:hypothetical protein
MPAEHLVEAKLVTAARKEFQQAFAETNRLFSAKHLPSITPVLLHTLIIS